MGATASTLPDVITKEIFQQVVGEAFDEEVWNANSAEGIMTKEKLTDLATVTAVCEFKLEDNENGDDTVGGTITFVQVFKEPTKITYAITGLPAGEHAISIHECADFSEGLETLGAHFNPHKKSHGGPTDEERHVGDLGNIVAGEDGVAKGEMTNDLVMLSGEFSVAGRSVLVMDSPDDCGKGGHENSLVNGNSGDPMAFGEIVRQKNGVKYVSTNRQNTFISQVTSSRIVVPTAEGGDQLHNNDDNDDDEDGFFKDQGEFDTEDTPAA